MKTTGKTLQVLAILIWVFQASGCSLIGFTVGAVMDGSSGNTQVNGIKDIENLDTGQTIKVIQASGDTIEGVYCGIFAKPTEAYEASFALLAHSMEGGIFPPSLGEPIRVVTDKEGVTGVVRGTFAGFDPISIYFHTTDTSHSEPITLGIITTIVDTLRRVIPGEEVRAIVRERKVPYIQKMMVVKKENTFQIPVEDIKVIETPGSSYAKFIGLGAGAIMDAVLIIASKNGFGGGWFNPRY